MLVRSWADAWSRQDVDMYLAFYAKTFRPRGRTSRARWESMRRERLTKPGGINVSVEQIEVSRRDDAHARVTFVQNYRSSNYQDHIRKILLLSHVEGEWRIVREINQPLGVSANQRRD
jgi:murein L,D-transpeptidase YafK